MPSSPYESLGLPERWFNEAAVAEAVRSLREEVSHIQVSSADDSAPSERTDDTQRMVVGTVAIVLLVLALLVGVLVVFGKRDPNHQLNLRSYITLAAVFILLPGGVFVWARFFYGKKAARRQERDNALRQLARRHDALRFGNGVHITGSSVGVVPWLASEIDKVVECDLHGSYRGHALTLLQCTYVVDMTLSAIESSFGKIGAAIMSHMEHEHIHRRSLEAVVFFDPLESLPDLFWAARKQPLNWYFKKQVGDLRPLDDQPAWLVSSDPQRCRQALTPQVLRLLEAKPEAIVQVLGGCLIVIPQTWSANRPVDMPNQADDIEANLNWACDLREALGGEMREESALPASGFAAVPLSSLRAEPVPGLPPEMLLEQAAPPLPVAAAPPGMARKVLRIAALVCGILFLGCGGLTLFPTTYLTLKANRAAAWPTVEGHILAATVEGKGAAHTQRWAAQVRYEYAVHGTKHEGNRLAIGAADWQRDRTQADEQVARYQPGQNVTVYYNPEKHEDAVLEPRLDSSDTCILTFGGACVLAGLVLVYCGRRRPGPR